VKLDLGSGSWGGPSSVSDWATILSVTKNLEVDIDPITGGNWSEVPFKRLHYQHFRSNDVCFRTGSVSDIRKSSQFRRINLFNFGGNEQATDSCIRTELELLMG